MKPKATTTGMLVVDLRVARKQINKLEHLLENAKRWAHEQRNQVEAEYKLRIAAEEKLKFKENLTTELTEARAQIKGFEDSIAAFQHGAIEGATITEALREQIKKLNHAYLAALGDIDRLKERIKTLEAPQWEIEKERVKVAMQREDRIRKLETALERILRSSGTNARYLINIAREALKKEETNGSTDKRVSKKPD